jgi:hypothetical protein
MYGLIDISNQMLGVREVARLADRLAALLTGLVR